MSLYRIAGPFAITTAAGDEQTNIWDFGFWYPTVGHVCELEWQHSYTPTPEHGDPGLMKESSTAVMTLDGVFAPAYQYFWPNVVPIWWAEKQMPMMTSWLGDNLMYVVEPRALNRQLAMPNGFPTYGTNFSFFIFYGCTQVADRMIGFNNHYVESVPWDGATQSWIPTSYREGPYWPEIGSARVWAGRTKGEVWVTDDQRCGGFYDTASRTRTSVTYYLPYRNDAELKRYPRHIAYCPEFGVVLAIYYQDASPAPIYTVEIFSLEVCPTTLSDVVVLQGEVKFGQVVTFGVTLTGDQQDPCPGELIDWTLTGIGTLLNEQSTTDNTGQATTQVLFNLTEIGSCVLEAKVTC